MVGAFSNLKTHNGVTTTYYLNGDSVVREQNPTDTIDYFYDEKGDLFRFNLNGVEYFYIRNGQNDIIGIVDNSGNLVVNYVYDTWGKLVSITGSMADTVGVKNPYRYRGYRYDTETGFYYLNSRYYDPETGRFINADDTAILEATQGELLSHNLFAYCNNNPVMNSDSTGYYGWRDFYRARWFVSNFINVVITLIIMSPAKLLGSFLKKTFRKVLKERAAIIFSDQLKKALLRKAVSLFIANLVVKAVAGIFTLLMWATDPGGALFDWVDAHDKRPKSGYIDW